MRHLHTYKCPRSEHTVKLKKAEEHIYLNELELAANVSAG